MVPQWTEAAETALAAYLQKVRNSLDLAEQDPDEVLQDLRIHIETELDRRALSRITVADVEHVVAVIGLPESDGPAKQAPPPSRSKTARFIFGGVFLPAVALLVELYWNLCAATVFDPIPTLWHVLVVGLVPIGFGTVIYQMSRHPNPRLFQINGVATGIALYYTLLFLPLLPAFLIGVIFLMGFLGLAPMIALYTGWCLHKRLRKSGVAYQLRNSGAAIALGFCLLIFGDLSMLVTDIGVSMATSESKDTRERGFTILEQLGSDSRIRQLAGDRRPPGLAYYMLSQFVIDRPDRVTYRQLLFQQTGEPYRPLPNKPRWFYLDRRLDAINAIDTGRDLTLVTSQFDGSMDPDGMVGYLEWKMAFENSGWFQREATAIVQLPPGAVVSRLTLWVNGEPREAAFAGRAQVTEAYNSVVRRRKDPVLVTMLGGNQIFVQCFPVTKDAVMQIRVGFTTPLQPVGSESDVVSLTLPTIVDRNFQFAADLAHNIWIESTTGIESTGHPNSEIIGVTDGYGMRLSETAEHTLASVAPFRFERNHFGPVWSASESAEITSEFYVATQHPQAISDEPSIVVLDGSSSMAPYWSDVVDVLKSAGPLVKSIFLAGPEVQELPFDTASRAATLQQLSEYEPSRGRDNVTALTAAWEKLALHSGGQVVWFHGPRPYVLSSMSPIEQLRTRRAGAVTLVNVTAGAGENAVIDALTESAEVVSVPLLPQHETFWRRLAQTKSLPLQITQTSEQPVGHQTSDHLARLWAAQQVATALASPGFDRPSLIKLAQDFRLVTPISGAVVLETAQQYDEAGLNPVDVDTVPSIPEPETWLLIGVAGLFLILLFVWRCRLPVMAVPTQ